MGSLTHFLLGEFIKNYKTKYFFETGTGVGEGLGYAVQFPFDKLFSTEIDEKIYEIAKSKFFGDARVTVLNSKSEPALDVLLQTLPQDDPVLFWLDAHFPGADYGLAKYDGEANHDVRLPLEREVEIIRHRRPLLRDVILIDDLRIYEEGAFTGGNMPTELQWLPPEKRNINFIYKIFEQTHTITRDYTHEGYLFVIPR